MRIRRIKFKLTLAGLMVFVFSWSSFFKNIHPNEKSLLEKNIRNIKQQMQQQQQEDRQQQVSTSRHIQTEIPGGNIKNKQQQQQQQPQQQQQQQQWRNKGSL